ncbi:chromosome partitioning protein ParA [Arthrobacter sp. MYb227]|uniref:ParA family protein n=1 Tax=Arthrobacter sp. MYb227 TaxID=1848601 RepID=UPI000CFBC354|nr:ParA family protein [Arthrobacter sp. MYb227]PQZ88646.1 chromosome partitioning protein ParA [Arthrobacter sp. MYb227]
MQVVSISSLKGGVGKTSVTLGLASAALAAGIPTLVIDLDPHADASTGLGVRADDKLTIGRMLKVARKADLSRNIVSSSWQSKAVSKRSLTRVPVLDVAVGDAYTGIYDRPDLRARDLRRLTQLLSRTSGYSLVLIDCPPSLNGLTRMAWSASDRVVLVAEPSLFSVAGTERTQRALEMFRKEYAPDLGPIDVVVNRVRKDSAEHAFRLTEMRSMFGTSVLTPELPEFSEWQQIQGAAYSVHQWPGKGAKRTSELFDSLLRNITEAPKLAAK